MSAVVPDRKGQLRQWWEDLSMEDCMIPLKLRGNPTVGLVSRMSLGHPWFLGYPKDNFPRIPQGQLYDNPGPP